MDTPEHSKKLLQYIFFIPALLYFIPRFTVITMPGIWSLSAAMFFLGWALVPGAKEKAE